MPSIPTIVRPLVVAAGFALPTQVSGQVSDTQHATPDWHITAGAAAFVYPRYPGSDEYRVVPFPMVDARYRDLAYLGPSSTGIGFALGATPITTEHFRVAVELGGQDSRPESRGDALAGMEDRNAVVTGGVSLTYRTGPFEGILAVSQGFNDGAGLIQTTRITYSRLLGTLMFSAAAGAALANAKQMRREFGISDSEAARRQAMIDAGDDRLEPDAGRAYEPEGGLRHLGAGISLIYPATVRWSLIGFTGVERLSDEAAESSLVRQREQFAGGVGVGYRF